MKKKRKHTTEKEKRRMASKIGRLAVCTDESIVLGPTLRFVGEIGKREEEAFFEALRAVEDEDDFFFARMDLAAALRDEGCAETGAEQRWSARKLAPLGFFDMTALNRPLPATGFVAAKNASSRDAVVFAENEEGDVVGLEWPRDVTIAFRDGKTDARRPALAKGKTAAFAPYMYGVEVGYEKYDGTTETAKRWDVGIMAAEMADVEKENFPLAFATEERVDAVTVKRREIRAWDGKFWSRSPSGSDPDERTSLEELELWTRIEARSFWQEVAGSAADSAAAAVAKKARLAKKPLMIFDGSEKESVREIEARRLADGLIAHEGAIWHEVGEPRYVVSETETGETRSRLTVERETWLSMSDREILPATMSKEEVAAYAAEKYGPPAVDFQDERAGVKSVEVVDPKFVTIAAPKPRRGGGKKEGGA